MACRKRVASWCHETWSKRRREAEPAEPKPLFTDSTAENFPCRYGDKVVSETSCFVLLEGLGSGAFGQVVRCSATPRGSSPRGLNALRRVRKPVALKILKHKDFCSEVSLEAEEEAKILEELKHPHIVQLLDFFEFQGHVCIALELLGQNLYELITELKGLMSIQLVNLATRHVLLALEYLKKHQVIHGDLKPENVLMVDSVWGLPDVQFKVIDFGGARKEGVVEDVVLQTLPYRAPEVLLGLPDLSCAADIWSLGCICIELFVGESLFSHSSDKDEILEGMVQLIGEIPSWMLKKGSRTCEFFDRVKHRPAPRVKPAQGWWRLISWAWDLREAVKPMTEVSYKFRRRSTDRGASKNLTLFGAFRQRRYDVVRRFGAPQRLAGPRLSRQQGLRRNMEKLIRRMLIIDPERRSEASECLRWIS